jgi:predicted nucleotidyltransferase
MPLPPFILDRRDDIAALCQRHHARKLDLFGSAVRADFEPGRSDLDFVVSFDELSPVEVYDAYFSLKEGLEGLFSRSVDLVVERAIRNPHFRARVATERQQVFHVA